MRDVELAWLAGIVDGEGCLHLGKTRLGAPGRINPSHRFYLRITMGHQETIERIHKLTGVGWIVVQSKGARKWNAAWTWAAGSEAAAELLRRLRPFLVTKAAEADIALRFLDLPKTPKARDGKPQPRISPELFAARETLWEEMRRIKPTFRFRGDPNDGRRTTQD